MSGGAVVSTVVLFEYRRPDRPRESLDPGNVPRAQKHPSAQRSSNPMPPIATSIRPASVLSQKESKPLRSPRAVGWKRTSTVQLSPLASATDSAHVPPGTTQKSPASTLDDAIPN